MRKDGKKNGQARPSDKPVLQGDLDYANRNHRQIKDMRTTPSDVLAKSAYGYEGKESYAD